MGTSDSQTLTNKSIAGSEINSGLVASTVGGTGVNNTATLTLGSSNQNWATLGTGIVKNTNPTGAGEAVFYGMRLLVDVIGLWTGSCTSSTPSEVMVPGVRGKRRRTSDRHSRADGLLTHPVARPAQRLAWHSRWRHVRSLDGEAGISNGGIEFPAATHFVDNYPASGRRGKLRCFLAASGTTTTCTIVNGGWYSLDPNGGVIHGLAMATDRTTVSLFTTRRHHLQC